MIAISFYLSIFSTLEVYGIYMQALVLLIIFFEAIRCIIVERSNLNSMVIPLPIVFLGIIMPLISSLVALIRGNYDASLFALILMIGIISIYICLKHHSIESIVRSYFLGMILISVTILMLEGENLVMSIIFSGADDELARFSPFNTHPNLIAHIFGVFACVCMGILVNKKRVDLKAVALALLVLSLIIIFGASSRGALVALVFSLLITSIYYQKRRIYFSLIIVGLIVTLTFFALLSDNIVDYMVGIFQLNHSARGLDSGLTGRVYGWPKVIEIVSDDFFGIFFGFGYRTWDNLVHGFEIDNSYINMIYETGVLFAVINIAIIIKALYGSTRIADNNIKFICSAVILFVILEGVVIRYLIAIGNSGSIFFLFIFLEALSNKKMLRVDGGSKSELQHPLG